MQFAEEIEPGAIGQLKIEDDDLRPIPAKRFESFRRGCRREDLDLRGDEDASERIANAFLVVYDEQFLQRMFLHRLDIGPRPIAARRDREKFGKRSRVITLSDRNASITACGADLARVLDRYFSLIRTWFADPTVGGPKLPESGIGVRFVYDEVS